MKIFFASLSDLSLEDDEECDCRDGEHVDDCPNHPENQDEGDTR